MKTSHISHFPLPPFSSTYYQETLPTVSLVAYAAVRLEGNMQDLLGDGHSWSSQSSTGGLSKKHTSSRYSSAHHSPQMDFPLHHQRPHAGQCLSATRGKWICCSLQDYIKDITWMSSDS